MTHTAAEVHVSGYVQGVGYRYFCYRRARDLGLCGWVRNEPDGSVALVAEGDRGSLEALITELKLGPPGSSVTRIDVTWRECSGDYDGFEIAMRY